MLLAATSWPPVWARCPAGWPRAPWARGQPGVWPYPTPPALDPGVVPPPLQRPSSAPMLQPAAQAPAAASSLASQTPPLDLALRDVRLLVQGKAGSPACCQVARSRAAAGSLSPAAAGRPGRPQAPSPWLPHAAARARLPYSRSPRGRPWRGLAQAPHSMKHSLVGSCQGQGSAHLARLLRLPPFGPLPPPSCWPCGTAGLRLPRPPGPRLRSRRCRWTPHHPARGPFRP